MKSSHFFSIRLHLSPNPDGVYTVTSPDVPGLVTEGRTPEEIQINVEEALRALIAAWDALGIEPPETLRSWTSDSPQTIDILVAI